MKSTGVLNCLKAPFRLELIRQPICPIVIALTFIFLSSCNEDEESPPMVNFFGDAGQIYTDDAEGLVVNVTLTPTPEKSGMVIITFTPAPDVLGRWDFRTDPPSLGNSILLPFAVNQTQTSFRVFPVLACTESLVNFTISNVTDGLKRGTQLSYRLAIKPREPFAIFNESKGTVNRTDAAGKIVQIDFSEPAVEDGFLFLYSSDGRTNPSTRYVTIPATEMDLDDGTYYIPVPFRKGEVGTQFTVTPANSDVEPGNYDVQFHLWGSSTSVPPYRKCFPEVAYHDSEGGIHYTLTIVN